MKTGVVLCLQMCSLPRMGLWWNCSERESFDFSVSGWGRTPDEAVAAYEQNIADLKRAAEAALAVPASQFTIATTYEEAMRANGVEPEAVAWLFTTEKP